MKYSHTKPKNEIDHSQFDHIKFSIVVPAHKDDKHIADCMQSIFKQGLENKDFEVLITSVDKQSNDSAFEIAMNCMMTHPDIRINLHGGFTKHSSAVKDLAGEYVVLLDGHDHLKDGCLNSASKAIFGGKEREDKYLLHGARRPIISRKFLMQNPEYIGLLDKITAPETVASI
jgi:cellulose synthase/poly-beta-1,6-N-acetylglucosamine synthase-like glycosyltransferase